MPDIRHLYKDGVSLHVVPTRDIITTETNIGHIFIMGGGAVNTGAGYDAALERRQALMGASGARALVKNFKVFRIAAFACIGGILYGYNQGMFSGILAMPAFGKRMYHFSLSFFSCSDGERLADNA